MVWWWFKSDDNRDERGQRSAHDAVNRLEDKIGAKPPTKDRAEDMPGLISKENPVEAARNKYQAYVDEQRQSIDDRKQREAEIHPHHDPAHKGLVSTAKDNIVGGINNIKHGLHITKEQAASEARDVKDQYYDDRNHRDDRRAGDKVKHGTQEAAEGVRQGAREIGDDMRRDVRNTNEWANRKGAEASDRIKGGAEDLGERTRERAHETNEWANRKAVDASERIKGSAEEVGQKTREKFGWFGRKAQESVEDTRDVAREMKDDVKANLHQRAQHVNDKAQHAEDRAMDAAKRVGNEHDRVQDYDQRQRDQQQYKRPQYADDNDQGFNVREAFDKTKREISSKTDDIKESVQQRFRGFDNDKYKVHAPEHFHPEMVVAPGYNRQRVVTQQQQQQGGLWNYLKGVGNRVAGDEQDRDRRPRHHHEAPGYVKALGHEPAKYGQEYVESN